MFRGSKRVSEDVLHKPGGSQVTIKHTRYTGCPSKIPLLSLKEHKLYFVLG